MEVKEVLFVIFWLLQSTSEANERCTEQCNLLVDKNMSAEFQSKSSEDGVRMVYLHLNVGNKSYSPLQSPEKFLPNRWTWARGVEEPMLYFSYQYQVLSLGLLTNQVRNMEITLSDEPRGCVAHLISSCKDIMVATTLLRKVTGASTDLSLSEDVVCVSVVKRDINWVASWFEGNIQYHCCKQEQSGNETVVQCDLPVKYSKWFMLFYHVLTLGIIVLFFYWPVVIPWLQKHDHREIQNNKIPVDDFSPITWKALLHKMGLNRIPTALGKPDIVQRMIVFYYIRVLFYAYIFLALNYAFFLDYLTEVDAKTAIPENALFYYVFDIRSSKPYCLIPVIIFFIILPANFFFFMAYASKEFQPHLIYRKMARNLSVRKQQQIVEEVLHKSDSEADRCMTISTASNYIIEYLKKKSGESSKMLFVILFLFLSTTFSIVLVPILMIISYSVLFLALPFYVLVFALVAIRRSPFGTLIRIVYKTFSKSIPRKGLYFCKPVFLMWMIYVSLAVTVCCGFYIRMVGFVLVGLIINAKKTTPYVAFIFISISNIYTSYNTLRKRFKEMKKIIYKYYKKKIIPPPQKTLPERLFWDVCEVVLPIEPEIFAMLANMVIIFSISLLAVAIIVFFSEVFNSSRLVEAGALVLSGKLTGILFNGMIKGEKFKGLDKIDKSEKVQECVDKYIEQSAGFNEVKPKPKHCESEKVTLDIEDSARESTLYMSHV